MIILIIKFKCKINNFALVNKYAILILCYIIDLKFLTILTISIKIMKEAENLAAKNIDVNLPIEKNAQNIAVIYASSL
jgi:hypothetical protein